MRTRGSGGGSRRNSQWEVEEEVGYRAKEKKTF